MNYELLVRRLRRRIFDYYDQSESMGLKAQRILGKAITKMVANYPPPKTDQWGATAEDRRMLASHGITWGD